MQPSPRRRAAGAEGQGPLLAFKEEAAVEAEWAPVSAAEVEEVQRLEEGFLPFRLTCLSCLFRL